MPSSHHVCSAFPSLPRQAGTMSSERKEELVEESPLWKHLVEEEKKFENYFDTQTIMTALKATGAYHNPLVISVYFYDAPSNYTRHLYMENGEMKGKPSPANWYKSHIDGFSDGGYTFGLYVHLSDKKATVTMSWGEKMYDHGILLPEVKEA